MQRPENVAIFWDFESIPPDSNQPEYKLVESIRSAAHDFGSVISFKAYLDTSTLSSNLRAELQASGVSLTDCPHGGRKDMADKMLIADLIAFAIDHPSPSTIFLISSDIHYAYAVSILRHRQYKVVIACPSTTHQTLLAQASAHVDWNTHILGNIPSASPAPPPPQPNHLPKAPSPRRSDSTFRWPYTPSAAGTNPNERGDDRSSDYHHGSILSRRRSLSIVGRPFAPLGRPNFPVNEDDDFAGVPHYEANPNSYPRPNGILHDDSFGSRYTTIPAKRNSTSWMQSLPPKAESVRRSHSQLPAERKPLETKIILDGVHSVQSYAHSVQSSHSTSPPPIEPKPLETTVINGNNASYGPPRMPNLTQGFHFLGSEPSSETAPIVKALESAQLQVETADELPSVLTRASSYVLPAPILTPVISTISEPAVPVLEPATTPAVPAFEPTIAPVPFAPSVVETPAASVPASTPAAPMSAHNIPAPPAAPTLVASLSVDIALPSIPPTLEPGPPGLLPASLSPPPPTQPIPEKAAVKPEAKALVAQASSSAIPAASTPAAALPAPPKPAAAGSVTPQLSQAPKTIIGSSRSAKVSKSNQAPPPPPRPLPASAFAPLVECLRTFAAKGQHQVYRSDLGTRLSKPKYTGLYAQANVVTFASYIKKAVKAGAVRVGGQGDNQWVALS